MLQWRRTLTTAGRLYMQNPHTKKILLTGERYWGLLETEKQSENHPKTLKPQKKKSVKTENCIQIRRNE